MTVHTVTKGETLSQIAKNAGCSVDEIVAANKEIDPNKLQIGQELTMPNRKTNEQSEQREFKTTDEKTTDSISEYKIQSGDNLSKIAMKYGCTVDQLKAANNLRSDNIRVGQKLIIPAVSTSKTKTTEKASSVPENRQQHSTTPEDKAKYLKKLTHSDTAVRNNIDNNPRDFQTQLNLSRLVENTVIPIEKELERNGIKIQISSGYRSPELNKQVGGAVDKNGKPKSQHCKGQAFDFQVIPNNKETIAKAFEIIKKSGIPVDQMLLERNKKGTQWIHVSYNPTGNNRRHLIENYKA